MIDSREATQDDKAFLWRLKVAAMREYVEAVYGWDEAEQYRFFEKGFRPEELRIIRLDGRDAGMYKFQVREEDLFLCRIEMLPELQGRGIGTTVIRGMIEEALKARKPLRLQVFKNNPAQRLYERLGFIKTGETDTHFKMAFQVGRKP